MRITYKQSNRNEPSTSLSTCTETPQNGHKELLATPLHTELGLDPCSPPATMTKTWCAWQGPYMGVSQNQAYHFGGPNSKDYSIWGSILGSSYFGKVPYLPVYDYYQVGSLHEGSASSRIWKSWTLCRDCMAICQFLGCVVLLFCSV